MNITASKTYTASEARNNLYKLIRAASSGLSTFEITLRGSEPVILINKSQLESWQETLDILSNKEETAAVRRAKKQKRNIPHKKMLKEIGIDNRHIN